VASAATLAGVPWWGWLGGVLGAATRSRRLLARTLRRRTLTALVVTGQLVCSVALDTSARSLAEHALSWGASSGCLLMVGGIVLIWRF